MATLELGIDSLFLGSRTFTDKDIGERTAVIETAAELIQRAGINEMPKRLRGGIGIPYAKGEIIVTATAPYGNKPGAGVTISLQYVGPQGTPENARRRLNHTIAKMGFTGAARQPVPEAAFYMMG
ncbi:TPA: hypothetical protein HA231_02490 [Candidatus Woesearchaeota archaeon]|nr:hypothetical protein [Candidatus Woesearchaeota archaeon]